VPAGYGWSFPADGEVRIGVGSFDPRFHVREPTERLACDLDADTVRYQGNWIPHALRDATGDGLFFVGDSAGHCLPLTAEGIRTAIYFGLGLRPGARGRARGPADARERAAALPRPSQPPRPAVPLDAPHATDDPARRSAPARTSLRAIERKRFIDGAFDNYLRVAHPDLRVARPPAAADRQRPCVEHPVAPAVGGAHHHL